MPNKDNNKFTTTLFHPGEKSVQLRSGADSKLEEMAAKAITPYMPDQHRYFLSEIPLIFIGAEDENNHIWSSVLCGKPSFINAKDKYTLTLNSQFNALDPLYTAININSEVGLLGFDFRTRRRNRINAVIDSLDDNAFGLRVKQCYGNCPKYIQTADLKPLSSARITSANNFSQLNLQQTDCIHQASRLFISSTYSDGEDDNSRGVDTSHRGGMPGFVKVFDEKTLLIPDYIGNNFFNTLGNISIDPRVGLHFIDHTKGYRLLLTGTAETVWKEDETLPFEGVDRMIRFSLMKGIELFNSFDFEWDNESFSPFSEAYLPNKS